MPTQKKTETKKTETKTSAKSIDEKLAGFEKKLKQMEVDVELLTQQTVIAQAALAQELGIDLQKVYDRLNG